MRRKMAQTGVNIATCQIPREYCTVRLTRDQDPLRVNVETCRNIVQDVLHKFKVVAPFSLA